MYYPSSENKGADQLRGYREADLRLCFRICNLLVFPWGGSVINAAIPRPEGDVVTNNDRYVVTNNDRYFSTTTLHELNN